ncbi:hypothetical protein Tco_0618007 [Tanacetum coccineum]
MFLIVIETIISISEPIVFNNYGVDKIRRLAYWRIGLKLECCFFDAWANKFTKYADNHDSLGHVVLILQLAKVKYLMRNHMNMDGHSFVVKGVEVLQKKLRIRNLHTAVQGTRSNNFGIASNNKRSLPLE